MAAFLLLIGDQSRPYWWCIVATVMFGKRWFSEQIKVARFVFVKAIYRC